MYLQNDCAHVGLSVHAPVSVVTCCAVVAVSAVGQRTRTCSLPLLPLMLSGTPRSHALPAPPPPAGQSGTARGGGGGGEGGGGGCVGTGEGG